MLSWLPDTELTTLPNGLRVVSLTMPHVQTVAFGAWVDVGARFETPAQNGLSHLLEHMAFKGTPSRNAQTIAEEFDAIGGSINAYTSMEHTVYYAKVLKEDVPKAAEVMADILLNSHFDQTELERERQVVLQEVAMHLDTPDDVVFDLFTETAYPNQPIGRAILGSVENVSSFSREDLFGYIHDYYHTQSMVLVAVGNIQHHEWVALAERYFSGIPTGTQSNQPPRAVYQGGTHLKGKKLEQLHVLLGFESTPLHDPNYRAAQLLAAVLGGGMSSRLFQEVREKRGLAYGISAFHQAYFDTGMLSIYTGCDGKQAGEVWRIIQEQLQDVSRNLSQVELDRARNQYRAGLIMAQESTSSLADHIGRHMLIYGKVKPAKHMIAEYDAVTVEQIQKLAASLQDAPPTITALGPTKTLEAAL